MKGLLLKDWYLTKKYCKAYFLIIFSLVAGAFFSGNMFFAFFACVFCGMIPPTLISYDERSKWMQYSSTLPYTKAQLVSVKYLIGLIMQLATFILTMGALAVRTSIDGNFSLLQFVIITLLMLIVSTLTPSVTLPFIFKLGAEKGRLVYCFAIGAVSGASAAFSKLINKQAIIRLDPAIIIAVIAAVCILAYALSWYISIVFFKKKEL